MTSHRHFSVLPALLIAACAGPENVACNGEEGIVASSAWVRAADAGRTMSAAYVELCNGGAEDRLIAVRFDGAEAAELHQTTIDDNGVARMTPAARGMALPSKDTLNLEPGGAHIMLIGLQKPLPVGEETAITLEFEKAAPLTLMFEVRSLADAPEHGAQ